MNDLHPRLDEQAEHENEAEDDGKPEQIGSGRRGGDVEAERGPERGDEAPDETAGTGIARDKPGDPGRHEHRDGDRQKGKNPGEKSA